MNGLRRLINASQFRQCNLYDIHDQKLVTTAWGRESFNRRPIPFKYNRVTFMENGLAVSIWTLVMEGMSGIYLELSFLDAFLNFGQSLIVMAVFITDTGELLTPLVKLWRKLWYGANVLTLPHWSQLSMETKHICEQFRNHHLELCKKEIAKDRRWRIKIYRKVFYGCEFVDWLIEMGLSKDRLEAVHYAKRLVDGRVLRHINNVYHFEDKQLLYSFCSRI